MVTRMVLFVVSRGAVVELRRVEMAVETAAVVVEMSTDSETGLATVSVALETLAGLVIYTIELGLVSGSVEVIAWQSKIAYDHYNTIVI